MILTGAAPSLHSFDAQNLSSVDTFTSKKLAPLRNEKYFDILASDESYLGDDFDLTRYQDAIRTGHTFTAEHMCASDKLKTVVALMLKHTECQNDVVEHYFHGKAGTLEAALLSLKLDRDSFVGTYTSQEHLNAFPVSNNVLRLIDTHMEAIIRTYGKI